MAEPSVQVPVSLIEEAVEVLDLALCHGTATKMRALIAQLAPTAVRTDYAYWPVIDPSTIRDVTPPKEPTA